MSVDIHNRHGNSTALLICEHASNYIPEQFNNLGLTEDALNSHIAWDPGAFSTACEMSNLINAKLVYGRVSRLLYDCNRPPEAPDAIPKRSESFDIPGNSSLDEQARADRIENIYFPFNHFLNDEIIHSKNLNAIVTVHSFSPVFHGKQRKVELGILHDTDSRFADAVIQNAENTSELAISRNEPYGPSDGVTHTLKTHGIANNLYNVMLEIRSDLISTKTQQQQMGALLSKIITESLTSLEQSETAKD